MGAPHAIRPLVVFRQHVLSPPVALDQHCEIGPIHEESVISRSPPTVCQPLCPAAHPHRHTRRTLLPTDRRFVPRPIQGYVMALRPAAVLLLVLFGAVAVAAHWPVPATRSGKTIASTGTPWRRTATGWEDMRKWRLDPPQIRSRMASDDAWSPLATLHPLVVASLQALLAAGVLVAGWPTHAPHKRHANRRLTASRVARQLRLP